MRGFWIWFFTILGLLALSALVFFLGPFIGMGLLWRIVIISLFWLTALTVWLIRRSLRLRRERRLEEEMHGASDDTPELREKMKDAMEVLKSASRRGGSAFLYDLPWYMIIGPSGAGKTTALINSQVKFPGSKKPVKGVGGTRHCDWFFAEEAVLIDTAGRYATQDSDESVDSKSWIGFLDMLAKNRPRQPVNGVIVAISIEDLMTQSEEILDFHANAMRSRLDELKKRLQISFPVYVMLTKMDKVAGFSEFWDNLSPDQRAAVWGFTFKPKKKNDNMVGEFGVEFDSLMEALADHTTDRLEGEVNPYSRARIFAFPAQMASLRAPLELFINKVFESTRFKADATLRGVYFTSGTQEGTAIDRVLGSLSRNFGAQGPAVAAFSGKGRSYFLTGLLQDVIFKEAGWVSTNLAHIRRMFIIKTAMYTALLLGAVGLSGAWAYSYMQNSSIVATNETEIDRYKDLAGEARTASVVRSDDLSRLLPALTKLRNLSQGHMTREDPIPTLEKFGLSQHEGLRESNDTAYRSGLNRIMLPRLMWRLERHLSENLVNDRDSPATRAAKTAEVYRTLKVYLMLGGQYDLDKDTVRTWMVADWAKRYKGGADFDTRNQLLEHLEVLMDRPSSNVAVNSSLIKHARDTLGRMRVAERVYSMMKEAAIAAAYPAWNFYEQSGQEESTRVFEERSGDDIKKIEVPGFYTYAGFYHGFLKQIEPMIEESRDETWVLGEAGAEALEPQYIKVRDDVMALYRKEFIALWEDQLFRIKLKSLGAGKDTTMIAVLQGPNSPLKQFLRSVRYETELTRDPPKDVVEGKGGGKGNKAAKKLANKALGKLGAVGKAAKTAKRLAKKKKKKGGGAAPAKPSVPYGTRIQKRFETLHAFAGALDKPTGPIDDLINNFRGVYEALLQINQGGAAKAAGAKALQLKVAAIQASAATMPGLVKTMAVQVATQAAGTSGEVLIDQLNLELQNNVTQICKRITENRYPFARKSIDDVSLAEMAQLFGSGGAFQKFFDTHLAGMVKKDPGGWTFIRDNKIAERLSATTLRQFQYADEINRAFMGEGSTKITFRVKPVDIGIATGVTLDIDGQKLNWENGPVEEKTMTWPGPGGGGAIKIEMRPEDGTSRRLKPGTWGLFRMLDVAAKSKVGEKRLIAKFAVGGRRATFEFSTDHAKNPFTLPALRAIQCPTSVN